MKNLKRLLGLAPLQIAQAVIGFGAIAAFTRLMNPEEFGRYALVLSASMLAHTVVFTWLEAAAFRYFAQANIAQRLNNHFATLLRSAGLIALAATFAVAIALVAFRADTQTVALVAFAATSIVFRFFLRIARESERAALQLTRYAASEAIYLIVGFGAGVAFLTVFDFGPAAPFAGLAVAGALVLLFDAPNLLSRAKGGVADKERQQAFFTYGAPLALALAIDLGVQTIARFILASQSGEAELGAYAAAFGLARPLDLMFMSAGAALAPLVFKAFEEEGVDIARDHARRNFELMAAIGIPAALGLALVAAPLSTLMVGASLAAETARVLPWLALAGLFTGFNLYYWSDAFQLAQRTGERAALMLAPGALQLALTFALAPHFGAIGAAMAAAGASFVAMLLLAAYGHRHLALPLPLAALGRIVLASLTMAMVVISLPMNTAAGLTFAISAGVGAYILTAIALDILDAHFVAKSLVRTLRAKFKPTGRSHASP